MYRANVIGPVTGGRLLVEKQILEQARDLGIAEARPITVVTLAKVLAARCASLRRVETSGA